MKNIFLTVLFTAIALLSVNLASADIDPANTTGCDRYSVPPTAEICSGTLDLPCLVLAYQDYKACVDADPLIAAYALVACDKANTAQRGQEYIDSLVAACADGDQSACNQIAHAVALVNVLDEEAATASQDFIDATAFCRSDYIYDVEQCCLGTPPPMNNIVFAGLTL